MRSEHRKKQTLINKNAARASRSPGVFFAELFLLIFAEHVNFALMFPRVAIIILSTVIWMHASLHKTSTGHIPMRGPCNKRLFAYDLADCACGRFQ